MSDEAPRFAKGSMPVDPDEWPRWRKRHLTPAIRVEGPFKVETREGTLECPDGWLAVDSEGFPYPIADSEFRRIYEPVEPVIVVDEAEERAATRAAWLAQRG